MSPPPIATLLFRALTASPCARNPPGASATKSATRPFYLANATEATADHSGNYSCGYIDLSISCKLEGQTWIPTIRLDGDDYTVENISYHYDHQTILLVDSNVLGAAGGDCPAVRHEVSFDETWLHSSSYNDNLTFLFGCDPRGPVPPEFEAYKINCTQFKSPPGAGPGDSSWSL